MCGIVGLSGTNDAAALVSLMMQALQHRGQEAAGIISREVTENGTYFYQHRSPGLVGGSFSDEESMNKLYGNAALGHVRYSTAGPKHRNKAAQITDAQPLLHDGVALVHNGNLTNAKTLRKKLELDGVRFETEIDTEVIMQLIKVAPQEKLLKRLEYVFGIVEGAYSLIILSRKKLIGVCDPLGIRPLIFGRANGAYIFASETCAFDIIGGEVIDEVLPGEIVVVEDDKISRHRFAKKQTPRKCIFEYIYFSRPDSNWDGENMYLARSRLGSQLAREEIARDLDGEFFGDDLIVVPVLDSGFPTAIGYAHKTHSRFSPALVRNHYVGRSFIEPTQEKRNLKVLLKHNVNKALVRDKRVVLVDDSVVRGTTARSIVGLFRQAGVKEVHLRIASSPIMYECHHGIDTQEGELLSQGCDSIEEANERLKVASGADSAAYLSRENMIRAVRGGTKCDACFSGNYPTSLTDINFDESIV